MKHQLALILLLAPAAQARIDETLTQCLQRYGEPINPIVEGQPVHFLKDGIAIILHFNQNRRCDLAYFSRLDARNQIVPLTDHEIEMLLQVNIGEPLKSTKVADITLWNNIETRYKATYDHSGHVLMVSSADGFLRHFTGGQPLGGF
jgi:hypothetical protein